MSRGLLFPDIVYSTHSRAEFSSITAMEYVRFNTVYCELCLAKLTVDRFESYA